MAAYQYTVIVGNVGGDPEKKTLPSGDTVTNFTVAITERFKSNGEDRERTNWYRVAAWRGLADVCAQYVHKGMLVMVTGTVSANAYMGQDGQPRASLELNARDVQFLSRAEDGQSGGNSAPDSPDIPF